MKEERLDALAAVARYISIEKMFSLMTEEETKEIWQLTSQYGVNTNIYDQKTSMKICQTQSLLYSAFGNHKLINDIYTYSRTLLKN